MSIRSLNVLIPVWTLYFWTQAMWPMRLLSSDIIGEIIFIKWLRGFIFNIFQCPSFVCFKSASELVIATGTVGSSYLSKVSRSTLPSFDTTNNLPKRSRSDSADAICRLFSVSFLVPILLQDWSFFFHRHRQFNGIRTNSSTNELNYKVSEYDKEIPQSHTADHPTAP